MSRRRVVHWVCIPIQYPSAIDANEVFMKVMAAFNGPTPQAYRFGGKRLGDLRIRKDP